MFSRHARSVCAHISQSRKLICGPAKNQNLHQGSADRPEAFKPRAEISAEGDISLKYILLSNNILTCPRQNNVERLPPGGVSRPRTPNVTLSRQEHCATGRRAGPGACLASAEAVFGVSLNKHFQGRRNRKDALSATSDVRARATSGARAGATASHRFAT